MSRETWALVGLEHMIRKRVLLSHCEVGLNVRRIHIHELRVRERGCASRRSAIAIGRDEVRAIHGTYAGGGVQVAHVYEGGMAVVQIVRIRVSAHRAQVDGTEVDVRAR